jgi:hypothetical protein
MSEREILIERAASAWRPRRPGGGLGTHSAWHDLDEAGRRAAFEAAWLSRQLEAALDPEGLSSTARAVLQTIRGRREDAR